MGAFVLLLRGVNVGGHNKVRKDELLAAAASIGGSRARTYLQSGNVVLEHGGDGVEVADAFRAALGLDVEVLVREPGDWAKLSDANPFPDEAAAEPRFVHVAFLSAAPDPDEAAALEAEDHGPDRVVVRGREAWIHYGAGAGRSKLTTKVLERRLGVTATARNWRSVVKLGEMLGELGA